MAPMACSASCSMRSSGGMRWAGEKEGPLARGREADELLAPCGGWTGSPLALTFEVMLPAGKRTGVGMNDGAGGAVPRVKAVISREGSHLAAASSKMA